MPNETKDATSSPMVVCVTVTVESRVGRRYARKPPDRRAVGSAKKKKKYVIISKSQSTQYQTNVVRRLVPPPRHGRPLAAGPRRPEQGRADTPQSDVPHAGPDVGRGLCGRVPAADVVQLPVPLDAAAPGLVWPDRVAGNDATHTAEQHQARGHSLRCTFFFFFWRRLCADVDRVLWRSLALSRASRSARS